MGKIIEFTGDTCVDLPPENLLEKAKGWEMEHCLVIGYDDEGDLCFGGTTCETSDILFLLERAKMYLMDGVNNEHDLGRSA